MHFRPATDADESGWQAFLEATRWGDFLHDWAWGDVAAFDRQPQRRYILEEDGGIVAIVAAQERPVFGGRAFWYVPHGPVLDLAAPEAAERVRAVVIGLREVAGFGKDRAHDQQDRGGCLGARRGHRHAVAASR